MCALFRKFIINHARPLCRGFYIPMIEPSNNTYYDKFALPENSLGENSDKKSGYRPSVLLSKINALGRRNLSTYACCAALQKYDLFSVKEILLRKLISNANAKNDGVEEQTEVLLLVEPIDEVALQNLRAYKENCVDISKEGFGGEIAEKETEVKQELGKPYDWIKKLLGDKVASACGLASGFSATLDRLMKTQNSSSRSVLEINPDHLIIKTLLAAYKSGSEDEFLRAVDLLVDSALISSVFSSNLQLIYLYLVPADLTVEQLAYVIRKRIKLSAEKPIFIFVDNVLPPAGAIMSATHEEKKDDDGFCNI